MSTYIENQSDVNDALHQAERICQHNKLRFTALRRKVLTMIWMNHTPSKAYDLLDQLHKKDTSAKPPTVYRTLDFLLANGLIHKLNSLNAYIGCSHPLKHDECYFLICNKCKTVKECCNNKLDKAISNTASRNQFSPNDTTLEIAGECKECMRRK